MKNKMIDELKNFFYRPTIWMLSRKFIDLFANISFDQLGFSISFLLLFSSAIKILDEDLGSDDKLLRCQNK